MGIADFLFGSETSKTTIPEWQERAIRDAISASYKVANLGFAPYRGADVAAMTPMQVAAMRGTNQAALAFGQPTVNINEGMPKAQNFNGMMAYSSAPMYDQALLELKRTNPEIYNALMNFQIKQSGGGGNGGGGNGGGGGNNGNNGGGSNRSRGNGGGVLGYESGTSTGGGYTSIRDMFDGGGPNNSGNTFSGGPLSGTLNTIGVRPIGSSATPTPTPAPRPAPVPPPRVVPRSEYF